ncbi:FAD-dependent oxidoreductase [Xylanimonas protaetiae]|uniref:FAD-dependent oxidoreductase n=1 Tax=Xylanimonas protaetiae TaxID=2509457 RepID=A0A4P6F7A8_9MICO|nr:FAD-dependent oxidoreductase [Xylanimonas protaetiae]QAY71652.1 FAD-dependent oxidoreductase [Xylanimonas protaetiae]
MCDVLVYAATAAGVCAAVAAAETGADVTLLEPGQHVGGMVSGGLGYSDVGDLRVLGGMAARFRADVAEHYGVPVGAYAGPEPHVAEAIFRRWLEQAGVDVVFGAPLLDPVAGVARVGQGTDEQGAPRLEWVEAAGTRYAAAAFVDASYEGDLLAAAGVPYAVGREDTSLYGESLAGRQEILPGMHVMPVGISPFAGDPSGRTEGPLLPQIKPEPLARVGAGDGGVMSYGYRVCLSRDAHRIPFTPSPSWNADRWELGRRLFDHWRRTGTAVVAGRLLGLEPNLPGDKCDGNSLGPFSLSVHDGSAWRYPDAGLAEREAIRIAHLHHAQDYLWFLATDPAVPADVRAEITRWGLPSDEFADTGHLPHQLYVREARRMHGAQTLTQHDLTSPLPRADTVAMGSYHIDIREVQRAWRWAYEHPDPVAHVVTEGYLSVRVPPYQIPYGCLTPRYEDCANLLVPVCLSASHVAFSSVRMEPQYQMLGQAAGVAAALAAHAEQPVQRVDVGRLQHLLTENGQVLGLPSSP